MKQAQEKITPRLLAQFTTWPEVKKAIKYFYPEDKNNYEDVFMKLRLMKGRKPKRDGEVITIFVARMEGDPENDFYSTATNQYSLSFRRWEEIANIPVEQELLNRRMYAEILAHLIWEMTFYGTEKDSRKKGKELHKIVASIKSKPLP